MKLLYMCLDSALDLWLPGHFALGFLTRELRACARASCRYDVGSDTRSLARLVDSCKLFFDFRLLSAFDSFWRAINKRNGDLYC